MVYEHISEEEYSGILEKMPICCVDLIISRDRKVLLVLRKNEPAKNQWWVPGGRIHKNEKLEDAAIRKAFEETGLKIKIVKKIGVYETFFKKGPFEQLKSGVHTIAVVFLMNLIEKESVKIDIQSKDYKWIDKIEEDLSPYIKKILEDSKVFS